MNPIYTNTHCCFINAFMDMFPHVLPAFSDVGSCFKTAKRSIVRSHPKSPDHAFSKSTDHQNTKYLQIVDVFGHCRVLRRLRGSICGENENGVCQLPENVDIFQGQFIFLSA